MGRLCGGAHEISGIKAPHFLCGWVVGGFVGWVEVGWVMGWVVGCVGGGWVGHGLGGWVTGGGVSHGVGGWVVLWWWVGCSGGVVGPHGEKT